ncbi:MAG: protein kinase [Myxococcales bacterium]|nr:protein kinase [Myxococcales bacterium]
MPASPVLHTNRHPPFGPPQEALTSQVLRKLNYEVSQELGRGHGGTVYRALHIPTKMEVALKTLRGFDPDDLYDLKREFRALCEIDHENLAHMYELVIEGAHCFFTMELVDGPHLTEWVRQGTPPGAWHSEICDRLCEALAQLAGVLEAMHGRGWIHRDVKPSNVRLSTGGRVVLLDFGLMATIRGKRNREHPVAGTVAYMPPEAVWTTETSAAADVYSLGVLAYECVTSSRPFVGTDLVQLDRLKRQGLPTFPEGTPEWLERLIRQMTDPDPEARPTASMISRELKKHSRTRISRLRIRPPMVGRERNAEALIRAFRHLSPSAPTVVRVSGPSGIGKTHLVRSVLERIEEEADATVLQGRCLPVATLPLPGIDGIADALTQELRRLPREQVEGLVPRRAADLLQLFPVFARVKGFKTAASLEAAAIDLRERRRHGLAALSSVLRKLSKFRKVVVWIDDFQWCDRDSAAFWGSLLHEPVPLLLVTTARQIESCHELLDSSGFTALDLNLGSLSRAEMSRLISEVMEGAPTRVISTITRESRGNPFLALQIAQHVQDQASEWIPHRSMSLADVLRERLADLGEDARRILEACCIATRPVTLATLATAMNVAAPARAAQELLGAGRLIEQVPLGPMMPLVPYHDGIREALVANLGAQAGRDLHLALAQTLSADAKADPVATFWHWRGAGNEDMARKYALRAGDRLMDAMAFDQAIQVYLLGLEVQDGSGDQSPIHERLGAAYEASGQGQLAGNAYATAARHVETADGEPFRARELRRRSAEALLRSGFIDEGYRKLTLLLPVPELQLPYSVSRLLRFCLKQKLLAGFRWLVRLKPLPATRELLERLDVLWSATIGMVWADIARSAYYQAFHTRFAFMTNDQLHRARALATESCYLAAVGPRLFRPIFEWRAKQAMREAKAIGDPHLLALTLTTSATAKFLTGEWNDAVEMCREAAELIERKCTMGGWQLSTAYIVSSLSLGMQGKIDEIESLKARALEQARLRDDRLASTWVSVGLTNFTFLARGEPEAARTTSHAALLQWPSSFDFSLLEFWALLGDIQTDLYEGRATDARQRFERALPRIRESLVLYNRPVRGVFHYLDGCTALAGSRESTELSDRASLLKAARNASRRLRRDSLPWARAMGSAVHAGHCLEKRKLGAARKALIDAEQSFERADMSLFKAAVVHHRNQLEGSSRRAFGPEVQDPSAFARCLLPLARGE